MFNRECMVEKCLCSGCPNVFEGRTPPKLVVRTSTRDAGKGLFAGEDIKNGTFLGEYEGEICYRSETKKMDGEDETDDKDETDDRVSLFQISAGKLCHPLLDLLYLTF